MAILTFTLGLTAPPFMQLCRSVERTRSGEGSATWVILVMSSRQIIATADI